MKIIFLCGSLEPGRDGVGDYTRRLAIEMSKQGHQVAAVSLNDWHVTNEFLGFQNSDNRNLQILRLPSAWLPKKRFERAKEWIDLIDPEWLSLQFVNFAFNLKGLHFGLGKQLSILGKGRKWHIMFHELWVGMAVEAKPKHVLWGKVQRTLIKGLVVRLKPLVIHTQSHLYLAQLRRLGFTANYLPLFSNIPKISSYNKKDETPISAGVNKRISFIVFGTIHPFSPVAEFVKETSQFAKKTGCIVSFTFIGRNGLELENWVAIIKAENLEIELLGEQKPERISELLSSASIGISTSSIAYIEKSGTVVAMREHGLPVICVAKTSQVADMQYVAPPYGILEYRIGNLEDCINMKFELLEINTISEVCFLMEDAFKLVN